MPCVRAARSVPRCASAWSRSTATSRFALASSRSVASVSWMASAVSSRSDEVMPKCTYAAASRGEVLSAQAVRKAITSWSVTASAAATASGEGGGACRTGSTLLVGTVPARACAASTSVSTRLHSSYLCASLQTRPISGSVYRPIMWSPLPPGPPGRGGPGRDVAAVPAAAHLYPGRRLVGDRAGGGEVRPSTDHVEHSPAGRHQPGLAAGGSGLEHVAVACPFGAIQTFDEVAAGRLAR